MGKSVLKYNYISISKIGNCLARYNKGKVKGKAYGKHDM